jgi:glucosamine--fructose-6-phosphate aminotransferase (isomerizing)
MQPSDFAKIMELGEIDEVISPILYVVPLQLLAYHIAVIKGRMLISLVIWLNP